MKTETEKNPEVAPYDFTDELCARCDGRGKLRNNRMIDGKYTFGFITCDECGGTGLFNPKAIHMPYE